MKKQSALIIGVTGQDGAYLADFLSKKKYEVYGVTRSKNIKNLFRLKNLKIDKKIKIIQTKKIDMNF